MDINLKIEYQDQISLVPTSKGLFLLIGDNEFNLSDLIYHTDFVDWIDTITSEHEEDQQAACFTADMLEKLGTELINQALESKQKLGS